MTDKPKTTPAKILVQDIRGHIERLENAQVALRELVSARCSIDPKFPHQGFTFVIDEMSGPLEAIEALVESYECRSRDGRAA